MGNFSQQSPPVLSRVSKAAIPKAVLLLLSLDSLWIKDRLVAPLYRSLPQHSETISYHSCT